MGKGSGRPLDSFSSSVKDIVRDECTDVKDVLLLTTGLKLKRVLDGVKERFSFSLQKLWKRGKIFLETRKDLNVLKEKSVSVKI